MRRHYAVSPDRGNGPLVAVVGAFGLAALVFLILAMRGGKMEERTAPAESSPHRMTRADEEQLANEILRKTLSDPKAVQEAIEEQKQAREAEDRARQDRLEWDLHAIREREGR